MKGYLSAEPGSSLAKAVVAAISVAAVSAIVLVSFISLFSWFKLMSTPRRVRRTIELWFLRFLKLLQRSNLQHDASVDCVLRRSIDSAGQQRIRIGLTHLLQAVDELNSESFTLRLVRYFFQYVELAIEK